MVVVGSKVRRGPWWRFPWDAEPLLLSAVTVLCSVEAPHSSLETAVVIPLPTFCSLSDILHTGDSRWPPPSRWQRCHLSVFCNHLWSSETGVFRECALVLWQIPIHAQRNTKMATGRIQPHSRTAHLSRTSTQCEPGGAAASDWERMTSGPGWGYMGMQLVGTESKSWVMGAW